MVFGDLNDPDSQRGRNWPKAAAPRASSRNSGPSPKSSTCEKVKWHGDRTRVIYLIERIREDLFRPLSGISRRYVLATIIAFIVGAAGLCAWGYQLYRGMGVTGLQRPVFWGIYMVDFVFWIGISHAGTLISAILRLTDAAWRKPVTRAAEAITVFALMIGGMFPIIHLGRAWLFLLAASVSQLPPAVA